jgi:hypothetical protein
MADRALPSVFFTELDSLFDTRLGTLLLMEQRGEAEMEKIVKGGYFTRDRDAFNGVDPAKFKAAYDARDKHTLRVSVVTRIIRFARDFGMNTIENNIKSPFIRDPKLIVNLHPYKLTQEERDNLVDGIRLRIGKISHIELVDMTYEQISTHYLRRDTSVIALYDPYEWLETQCRKWVNHPSRIEMLRKDSCPGVMMIGPLMIKNLDDRTSDIRRFQTDMEMLAKPIVDLELMVTTAFSADIRVTKPQPKSDDAKSAQGA